jgi:hypothetical protein
MASRRQVPNAKCNCGFKNALPSYSQNLVIVMPSYFVPPEVFFCLVSSGKLVATALSAASAKVLQM